MKISHGGRNEMYVWHHQYVWQAAGMRANKLAGRKCETGAESSWRIKIISSRKPAQLFMARQLSSCIAHQQRHLMKEWHLFNIISYQLWRGGIMSRRNMVATAWRQWRQLSQYLGSNGVFIAGNQYNAQRRR